MNSLQALLGIELPIIQAPMAGVQGSALAAAVSEAGGLGSLPCGMLSVTAMHRELAAVTAATSKPFNVNFFCHTLPVASIERETIWKAALAPYYKEYALDANAVAAGPARAPFDDVYADALREFKPAVISFHFGLPAEKLLARVRAYGAKILSSATTVAEAQWLESRGVDAIIAQGLEAGGHRGMFLSDDLNSQVGTFALLPQIVRAVQVPVIAAGGIADAQGVAAALKLGAAGVQIGTSYLLCPEATTSSVHRAALKSDLACRTAVTNLFSGGPARGIVNRLMKDLGPMSSLAPAYPLASAALAALRTKAENSGRGDFSPLWSGQNASGCKEISAAQLTQDLASGGR